MTIQIENATRSLAYVSVERMIGSQPISEQDGVKAYEADYLWITITTMPQLPTPNDVVSSETISPGHVITVDDGAGDPRFSFPESDPGYGAFGVELLRKGSALVFRILPADVDNPPPLNNRH